MKRRDFFKKAGIGAAAVAAVPTAMTAQVKDDALFEHDPRDYATMDEETEEFQEYEIDVPEDWAEEEIVFV